MPQGVTTVADAQEDQLWGEKQAILFSLDERVARWPMDGDAGTPILDANGVWRATSAYRLPKPRVHGAVSTSDRWYLNSTGGGETGPGHLQAAVPVGTAGTGVLTHRQRRARESAKSCHHFRTVPK